MAFEDISTIEECTTASAQALANHILACWEENSKDGDFLGVGGFDQGSFGVYQACLQITGPLFFQETKHSHRALLSSFLFLLPNLPVESLIKEASKHPSSQACILNTPSSLRIQQIISDLKKEFEKANQIYLALPTSQDKLARLEKEILEQKVKVAEQSLLNSKIVLPQALVDTFKKEVKNMFEKINNLHDCISPLHLSSSTQEINVTPTGSETIKHRKEKEKYTLLTSSSKPLKS